MTSDNPYNHHTFTLFESNRLTRRANAVGLMDGHEPPLVILADIPDPV